MEIQKGGYLSINQAAHQFSKPSPKSIEQEQHENLAFREILYRKSLETESKGLKFSKHAATRLADRGISLSDEQMLRLENGAWKAKQKGIKDSLMIMDSLAFIVNIPNQTVVTAIDSTKSEDQIFTNINGAVIC